MIEDLEGEIWRDIPDYVGYYQVSNMGRVKSFHKKEPKILVPNYDGRGYYYVKLMMGGKNKDPKIIRYQTSNKLSAYFELNMEELNYELIEKEVVIETNPFYRFTDIFNEIMNPDLQEGIELRKEMENIILHIL